MGTQFSDSMSEGMSIDTTVESALEAQFWGVFSEKMGMSVTTGYDWTQTSEITKSEQTTITVEAEAPPGVYNVDNDSDIRIIIVVGLVLIIEQAVGHCDDSEARTERFKTSHQDSRGNIVFSKMGMM